MTTILLDKTLKPQEPQSRLILTDRLSDKRTDWRTKETTQTLFPVQHNTDHPIQHQNYLEYLEIAWGSHLGVVLSPDIIWYMLLCEAALIVASDPEKYREGFTRQKEGKTDIVVQSDSDTVIPLGKIMAELRRLVPGAIAERVSEDFTTTGTRARLARFAAFADMVSPYYNYMMFACGIPSVRLDGTEDDWHQLGLNWTRLGSLLPGNEEYFLRSSMPVAAILEQFRNPDLAWLKGMFALRRCGSGSDTTVQGWITDLFRERPRLARVSHFSTHVSTVKYKNITSGRNFEMKQGLFGSRVEDDVLVPDFGMVVYEKRQPTQ